jgi:flavin reductase (DIM6/NTAB) family NADH-FMN oxidoreductase RutF
MKLSYDMLAHGVNIVCAEHEGKRGGLAVAWATQVAKDKVLICVGGKSATRKLILGSGAFGLSVLSHDQIEVARLFGTRSSRDIDKFADVPFHTAETGAPLLDNCVIALDCRVTEIYDHGDQKLIVGKVTAAEHRKNDTEPLLYREIDY